MGYESKIKGVVSSNPVVEMSCSACKSSCSGYCGYTCQGVCFNNCGRTCSTSCAEGCANGLGMSVVEPIGSNE